jgi:hypothetical protein
MRVRRLHEIQDTAAVDPGRASWCIAISRLAASRYAGSIANTLAARRDVRRVKGNYVRGFGKVDSPLSFGVHAECPARETR